MESLIKKYTDLSKPERVSKFNPEYIKIRKEIKLLGCGCGAAAEKTSEPNKNKLRRLNTLKKLLVQTPSIKPKHSVIRTEDNGTRVYYNRYADKWLVGVTGNKELAIKIKEEIKNFLLNYLSLTLSEEKTKISHVASEKINYLGFLISSLRRPSKYKFKVKESKISRVRSTKRLSFASIIIEAPIDKLINKLISQGYA
jgi:hypothetical protein